MEAFSQLDRIGGNQGCRLWPGILFIGKETAYQKSRGESAASRGESKALAPEKASPSFPRRTRTTREMCDLYKKSPFILAFKKNQ